MAGGARRTTRDWMAPLAKDLLAPRRGEPGGGGGDPAPGRARPRPRHQREAGQRGPDGRLHREPRGAAGRPGRVPARAGQGHARGQGRDPRSSWAATRSTTLPPTSTSPPRWTRSACACSWSLYEDETTRALPLARARRPLPRDLERRPRRPTARSPSCSRSWPRSTAASPSRSSWPRCWAGSVPSYEVVREHWRTADGAEDFEQRWPQWLHDGTVPGTALPERAVSVKLGDWATAAPAPASPAGLELVFRPDPSLFDGRFANNGWLQELSKPLTKLTWDNAAHRLARHREAARPADPGGDRAGLGDRARGPEARRPHRARRGLDPARASRRRRHRAPGPRPDQGGPRGQRDRLRRLHAPHERRPLVRPGPRGGEDRPRHQALLHPEPLEHGGPAHRARHHGGRVRERPAT